MRIVEDNKTMLFEYLSHRCNYSAKETKRDIELLVNGKPQDEVLLECLRVHLPLSPKYRYLDIGYQDDLSAFSQRLEQSFEMVHPRASDASGATGVFSAGGRTRIYDFIDDKGEGNHIYAIVLFYQKDGRESIDWFLRAHEEAHAMCRTGQRILLDEYISKRLPGLQKSSISKFAEEQITTIAGILGATEHSVDPDRLFNDFKGIHVSFRQELKVARHILKNGKRM